MRMSISLILNEGVTKSITVSMSLSLSVSMILYVSLILRKW